jgi:hypothetical protein
LHSLAEVAAASVSVYPGDTVVQGNEVDLVIATTTDRGVPLFFWFAVVYDSRAT